MSMLDKAWTALEGAGKYVKAIATGDVADDRTRSARCQGDKGCAGCPTLQFRRQGDLVAGFCGEPLDDRMEAVLPSCGCLCAFVPIHDVRWVDSHTEDPGQKEALLRARLEPAGKVVVASESCPQFRWGSV